MDCAAQATDVTLSWHELPEGIENRAESHELTVGG